MKQLVFVLFIKHTEVVHKQQNITSLHLKLLLNSYTNTNVYLFYYDKAFCLIIMLNGSSDIHNGSLYFVG